MRIVNYCLTINRPVIILLITMSKSDDTKARIIAATIDLLQERGYHATGLNQIVQESGTPKGSLYFHFPNGKEEIVAEAIHTTQIYVGGMIKQALDSNDKVGEAIYAVAKGMAQHLKDSDYYKGCAVASITMDMSGGSNRLQKACDAAFQSWLMLYENRFIKAGFPQSQAKSWAILSFSIMEGALLVCRAQRDTEPLDLAADLLKNLIDSVCKFSGL
ncbi:TetR family transcriptional regulator [candidate division LCP-89 bacterium B3_LCP]|uniref:TetR family transcriptional regulator n=1 Tax=candidate division LCP-89 bacterium B3_LCP TaxID=2012998 RepID=A0A532UZH1_UNCL8|nr:MAG: TetR family transcriptional regulator [candidate division LCP-89 bacterium B3_LCP]